MRTRNLIASSAQSASLEMTNSIAPGIVPSFPATATSVPSSSSSFHTGKKRPAGATNHPWRFKGKQKKQMNQELHPKAVWSPWQAQRSRWKWLCSWLRSHRQYDSTEKLLWAGNRPVRSKFRESITEILKQWFPFVRPDHFDFVKRERNKVTTPIVRKSLEWNYKLLEFGGLHSADATV